MSHTRYRSVKCVAVALALIQTSSYFSPTPEAVSPDLVISQVYGAGGNVGALLNADYIELYNRGTAPVSLGGLSLQYASATSTGNFGASATQLTELPAVTLNPGQYFLVQEASGAAGAPLPTPDFIDPTPIAMAAGAGKVAIVSGIATLGCNGGSTPCDAAALARIIDLVGYGNANFFEGPGAAPTLSTTSAAFREGDGAIDTDNNFADFSAMAPGPRNGGNVGQLTLSIADVSIAEGDSSLTPATFTITLSGPAGSGGVQFTVTPSDGTAQAGSDYVAMETPLSIASGGMSATYDVQIVGDFTPEPDETFVVTVHDVVGAAIGDGEAIGTIRNDDVPAVAIHDLQGSGAASPYVNQIIGTSGIVTGLKINGFFIQTPDNAVDALPESSEGVFVFLNSAPTVAIGDEVRVTGRVVEFRRTADAKPDTLTEIGGTVGVTVLSSGHALPAAIDAATFDASAASRNAQLERYESMLVSAASLRVVSPTNGFGEFYGVLSGTPRPFREPGIDVGDTIPAEAPSPATIPRFDGNFERIMVDSDEALNGPAGVRRPAVQVATGATVSPVFGPLDYAFDEYRVSLAHREVAQTPGVTVIPAPAPASGELTISSINVLNFFPPNPANPAQVAAFENRLAKSSLVVRTVLRAPDILGLIEVGDINVLRQLRDRINADAGTSYEAYLLESDDDTENDQDVGFLVNLARVTVASEPVQLFRGATFELCGVTDVLFDRPPFLLEASFQGTPVTVILNHLRSLIDVNANTTPFRPAPCTETVGSRVREKRRLGAESLADVIESRQHDNLVVLGDMNAFEFSDGYVDVIGTLEGSPAAAEEVAEPSADRWDHTLVNLARLVPPQERYSYVFEGSAQVLDHILVNQPMLDRLTRFTYARPNADFPAGSSGDPSIPDRLSDHDAPVAYFSRRADLTTTTALPATVVSGSAFTYEFAVTNAGPDAASGVAVTNLLPANATFSSVSAPDSWTCAPVGGTLACEAVALDAGATATFVVSMTVPCGTDNGRPLVSSTSATSPTEPDASRADNSSTDSGDVSDPAPAITDVFVDKPILSPANGKPHLVHVFYSATDNCGPLRKTFLGVESSDATGRSKVLSNHLVRLWAKKGRRSKGDLFYTITIYAKDGEGHLSTADVVVTVPRN
jgi:uncharacterized repeat protein (TIGR01451 family)